MNRRLALAGSLATISRLVLSFTMRLADSRSRTADLRASGRSEKVRSVAAPRQSSTFRPPPTSTRTRADDPAFRSPAVPRKSVRGRCESAGGGAHSRRKPPVAARVLAVGLDRHRLERCADVPGLEQYPEGTFALLGKTRLDAAALSPARPSGVDTRGSRCGNSRSCFLELREGQRSARGVQAYLEQHPNGHFARLARARLSSPDVA
jgi:hypothetical protein